MLNFDVACNDTFDMMSVVDDARTAGIESVVPIARKAPGKGGRAKSQPLWLVPYTDVDKVLSWADAQHLSVDPALRAFSAHLWEDELHSFQRATASSWDEEISVTGLKSTLLPTQRAAVAASADAYIRLPKDRKDIRVLLDADEPGLGKTITALSALRVSRKEARRAVIVCPSSLTGNWVAEMSEHFLPGTFHPWVAEGTTAKPIPAGVDTVIVGWAVMASWTQTLQEWGPEAVVADEGHYAKSGRAKTRAHSRALRETDVTELKGEQGTWLVVDKDERKQLVFMPKPGAVGAPPTPRYTFVENGTRVKPRGALPQSAKVPDDAPTPRVVIDPLAKKRGADPTSLMLFTKSGRKLRDAKGNVIMEKVDEKISGSARATGALDLFSSVRMGLLMVLTGTPIVNRPAELLTLLDMLGVLPLFGGERGFLFRYCGPERKSIRVYGRSVPSWEFKGGTHLEELNTRLLTSGHFIRRTKQLLIRDGLMKPKLVDGVDFYDLTTARSPWRITLTGEDRALYDAAEGRAETYFADLLQGIEASAGDARKAHAQFNKETQHSLGELAALRSAVALAKAPAVIAKVKEVVARGEKVVIAAHHRDVVDAYAQAFSGLKIQGGMSTDEVEEAKRLFNERGVDEHPVLVLSIEGGKTGHTLCKQEQFGAGRACAFMVLAEQIWTPGDELQVQDRIWRIGQPRVVRIINAVAADTVDEMIYNVRASKYRIFNTVINSWRPGEIPTDDERSGNVDLARHLATRGLGRVR